jgi:transposase
MSWKKLLESASESLNDHLRLRNDYLMAENRILRNQIDGRVQLTDHERRELAEIGVKLGKSALAEIATVAQADTILAWHRKFANQTVDTSARPKSVGRPRVAPEIEEWVIRMARENRSWGYDRIQGSLKHLGYTISDQTVGNILSRHGIAPAPERKKTVTWGEFVRSHWNVFVATGFFDSDIWSWFGLAMSCLLSFIHFSRHQVQAVKTAWHQHILCMQAQVQRFLNLGLLTRGWTYKLATHSCTRQDVTTGLEHTASQFESAAVEQMRCQDTTQGIVLAAKWPQPIRAGPVRCRREFEGLLTCANREAA